MTIFLLFFFMQFVAYALITANTRAISKGSYSYVFVTDLLIAFVNFVVFKRIASDPATNIGAIMGYTFGGAFGSMMTLWIEKRWHRMARK